jgi:PKD repeat protein
VVKVVDYSIKSSQRSRPHPLNSMDWESAYSTVIGILLIITITMITGGIVLLVLTSHAEPDKVPIAYLSVSQSGDKVELFNKAGDTLTSKSIAILVDGIDKTTEFRKPNKNLDWGTLTAGEQISYIHPTKPKSITILYVGHSGQYLLASLGPVTITPITVVPSLTPTPKIPDSVVPTIMQITPRSGSNDTSVNTINVTGTGFLSGASIKFNGTGLADIPATQVIVVSSQQITCMLNLTAEPAGLRNVVVTNTDGKGTMLVGGFIVHQAGALPIVNFTATSTNGTAPLIVHFNDTSTGSPVSWAWTFGDGGTSNIQNASHQYDNSGTYSVNLTVTNANGTASEVKKDYITVTSPVVTKIPPTAQFTASVMAGQTPLTVQFTDKSVSTGTTTYAWDINNDGIVDYTSKNPSHIYQTTGTYTVKLTVKNESGSASEIKSGYITVTSPVCSTLYLSDSGIKGDGSDETTTLQNAFNYAAANGYCAISFPAGKTIGTRSTVTAPANIELIGNGCTLKLVNSASVPFDEPIWKLGAFSYVHNLVFDGNKGGQSHTTNGLRLAPNIRLENNEIMNIGAYTVYTYRDDNVVISNNLIHDINQYGIGLSGEGFPTVTDYCNNATITNNIIYNCGQVGIKIRQTSNSLVSGNLITVPTSKYDDAPAGIRLYTFDGANHHITITNNQIYAPGDGAIAISSDDSANTYITITNNQITEANVGIKIKFNNAIITGNTITYRSTCISNGGSGNTISGNSCN